MVNDNVEFELEEILDSKPVRKTLKYLVRGVGYNELIWETAELLKDSPELVQYFHRKYPTKPKCKYLPQL